MATIEKISTCFDLPCNIDNKHLFYPQVLCIANMISKPQVC